MLIRILIIFILLIVYTAPVSGQDATSSGVAIPTIIDDQDVAEGSIICSTESGYKLCNNNYQSSIYGIVTNNPGISIGDITLDNEKYVLTNGIGQVRVSAENDSVKEGDLITTSRTPGVGVKATRNGYILGSALNSLENGEGLIFVSINIHPTTTFEDTRFNLLETLRSGLSSVFLTPLSALRYILAAIVTVSSFILAFVYFGRLARGSVEAVARNPLAQSRIQFTVLVNILITFAIFIGGLALAYLILVL